MARQRSRTGISAALTLSCVGFALGALGGVALAGWLSERGSLALQTWMSGYALTFSTAGGLRVSFWEALWDAARWPVFLWLLGYTSLGLWMVPVALGLRGFLLSFCVAGLAGSVRGGLTLAFLLFGLGNMVTLPVCFFLAVQSWEQASALRGRLFARPGGRSGGYWRKSLLALGAVILGALVEFWLLPPLLEGLAPLLNGG